MSLDDELRKAVEESEAEAPAVAADPSGGGSHGDGGDPPGGRKPERPGKSFKNIGFLAALLVMAGAILTLVLITSPDAAVYSKGVDELVAEKEKLASRNVRVTGMLVKGTLKHREEPCEYRFQMQKNEAVLPVRFAQCIVPDTFRDMPGMDVEVTAEGKLASDGTFEAAHIMAKCPSKYEMKQRAAQGEQAPHAIGPAGTRAN